MHDDLPLLYSFRRCPYAMRARLALGISGQRVILREIKLSQKPVEFLQASAKGEVPALVMPEGQVIDESLDIMDWALTINDPEQWRVKELAGQTTALIEENDQSFKQHLDHYKYFERFPEGVQLEYRQQAEVFLQRLEALLQQQSFLLADRATFADMALLPFIRQFAGVDPDWFNQSKYQMLRQWLNNLLQGELFNSIMPRYPFWSPEQTPVFFPPD